MTGPGLSSTSLRAHAAVVGGARQLSTACHRLHVARLPPPLFRRRGEAVATVQALPPNPFLGAAAATTIVSQAVSAPSLTEPAPPVPPPASGEGGNFALAQRLRQLQEQQQQQQTQTSGQQQTRLSDTAAVMTSAQEPGSGLQSAAAAADAEADGGSSSGSGSAAGAADSAATPSFCEPETLTGLMRQFVERQEGFDSGVQVCTRVDACASGALWFGVGVPARWRANCGGARHSAPQPLGRCRPQNSALTVPRPRLPALGHLCCYRCLPTAPPDGRPAGLLPAAGLQPAADTGGGGGGGAGWGRGGREPKRRGAHAAAAGTSDWASTVAVAGAMVALDAACHEGLDCSVWL